MNKYLKFAIFSILSLLFILTSCKRGDDNNNNNNNNGGNIPTTKEEYTVSYIVSEGAFLDGTTFKEEKYDEGTTISIIKDIPVLEGYDFAGWKNVDTNEMVNGTFMINNNIVLESVWAEETYQVTLKAGVGKFLNLENEIVYNVEKNTKFKYSDLPIHEERMFTGWFDEDDNYFVEGTVITKDITLKAKYRTPGNEYNLTYVYNTLQENKIVSYFEGINSTLEIPSKEGFEFLGWYTSSEFEGDPVLYHSDQNEGDVTYYAKWEILSVDYAETLITELVPNEITTNINLASNYQGAKIRWTTSDPMLINLRGEIFPTHKDETLTLTAKVTYDSKTVTIEKDVMVKAIMFEEIINPVAGYFYATSITNLSDTVLNNLDIVYYAFAHISDSGNVAIQSISSFDKLVSQGNILRQNGIRVVLSIAGGAAAFSAACRKIGTSAVAENIVALVDRYHLDGVDIDWEFPNDYTDMTNLTNLCSSIRTRLDKMTGEGCSPYLVTAAIPSHDSYVKFDYVGLNKCLDYVNMMSYDMNLAGQCSHLCPTYTDRKDGNKGYSCVEGIRRFTEAGLDKEKIILGAAFYGKAYKVLGVNRWESYPGLGSQAELTGLQYSSGTVTYEFIARNILTDKGYKRYWHADAGVPFLYNETTKIWITYEDEQSLTEKVKLAYSEGVGLMFWEYGYDYNNILTDTICNEMQKLRG